MPKTFGQLPRSKFTPPKQTRGGNNSFITKKQEVPLTGQVQGMKAAEGEERLARTLEKAIAKGIVREHRFRWTTLKRSTMNYKELDELVIKSNGEVVAISVKGASFVHRGTAAMEQDKLNELIIMVQLRKYGYRVNEVVTVKDSELKTQDEADKVARKLGLYR